MLGLEMTSLFGYCLNPVCALQPQQSDLFNDEDKTSSQLSCIRGKPIISRLGGGWCGLVCFTCVFLDPELGRESDRVQNRALMFPASQIFSRKSRHLNLIFCKSIFPL